MKTFAVASAACTPLAIVMGAALAAPGSWAAGTAVHGRWVMLKAVCQL